MIKRCAAATAMLALGISNAAETVTLKGGASLSGTVLAEKAEQVIVDIGYTVLAVPREAILSIGKPAGTTAAAPSSAPVTSAAAGGFFRIGADGAREGSVRELVGVLGESVVQVRTPGGLGSGFFINEDGYLITNFHVIEGETKISIEVYHVRNGQLDRKSYKDLRIVAMNKFADLALLKVEDAGAPKFKPVPFGDVDALAVGERVFAIGSPLGLERTVTEGIMSTKTREMQGALYLQTTTQINPGNSGGPLFNLRGEVIGVTNMKLNFAEGLGFAIPSDQVRYFLRNRDAYAYDNDNPSNAFRYLDPPNRMKAGQDATEPGR
jgi:serine protease Do